ncbi:MAG TPA: alpha/beta hydrolase [Caldimonas sp.]|jgi:pimeloyl-ACP methyl ester carboxylesterase|nr:alpha/beta hydrolase [Caldimonas sp.]
MSTLQVGASTLYYELYDDTPAPGRPTLVLLHGVGGNHASWFYQVTAWRTGHRLLVVDARGFGNSSDTENAGRDRFIDDLAAVLDAVEVDRAVLVAQSMGGGTAAGYTCRHPQRVAALVLADTLVGLSLPAPLSERMAVLTERNASLTQVQRVLGPTFVAAHPALATLYTALASFNRYNVRTLPGVGEKHTLADLAATKVPLLFVVGEEDVLFPPAEVKAAQLATPGSSFVELPQAGHSAYFETPVAFNDTVLGWIASAGVALR